MPRVDDLQRLHKRIRTEEIAAPPQVVERAEEAREDVEETYDQLVREDGYIDFALDYLNGDASRPRCSCPDPYCPIKHGNLTSEFETEGSFEEAVRTLKRRHNGNPIALHEARDAYLQEVTEVRIAFQRSLQILKEETLDYVTQQP